MLPSLEDIVAVSKRAILIRWPTFYAPAKALYQRIGVTLFSRNLDRLALIFRTDKYETHSYTPHYQNHFKTRRLQALNILEIGVGGYRDPTKGGSSLRMWKYYFPRSHIFGIDIHDKSALAEDRISIFQGSQNDSVFLNRILDIIGPVDIVIDDGSHVSEHILTAFKVIFPRLSHNGIYAIEDTHTSYSTRLGGDYECLNNPNTSMGFFKQFVDELNWPYVKGESFSPVYLDQKLSSIHFYPKLVIMYKG